MADKRLIVRLPSDHPIWLLPVGSRSAWARQALDMAGLLAEMESRLDVRLGAIDARLTGSNLVDDEGPSEPTKSKKVKAADIDADAFLAKFG